MAWISPRRTSRLTSDSARTPGNVLVMPCICRMCSLIGLFVLPDPGTGSRPAPSADADDTGRSCHLGEVGIGVVTGGDQLLLVVRLVDDDRVQQVRRHDLH